MTPVRTQVIGWVQAITPHGIKSVVKRVRAFCAWSPYQQISYSQEGEDIVLSRLFGSRRAGFFVDVGAHHPCRFSNSYVFYRRGWRGISIDAMPGSKALFDSMRPRDINIEAGISNHPGPMKYYQFNEPALNSFSPIVAASRDGLRGYKVVAAVELETVPLRDILAGYLPAGAEIDFMSVDVEGMDFDVLESSDWTRYRPKVVMIEMFDSGIANVLASPVYEFMTKRDYELYAKTVNTVFFLSTEYLRERKARGE